MEVADRTHFAERTAELCARFREQSGEMRSRGYDEATMRLEYLDPLFSSLGWNMWNSPPQPLHLRDVAVENWMDNTVGNRGGIRPSSSRVDYVFRTNGLDRWACEAKRPFEYLERHFFQIQNYTYHLRLWVGVLSDFEQFLVFVVGGRPSRAKPFSPVPGWRLRYSDYLHKQNELWDLFSKPAVESGSLERFVQGLGKVSTRAKQGWLIKPDRTKTVDADFLRLLEDQRPRFAKDIAKRNPTIHWTGTLLADALQTVFDRIIFQRVSEDRGIDVGVPLFKTLLEWENRGKLTGELWPMLSANFRHLANTFNGGIYGKVPHKPHLADSLHISDSLLSDFIDEIAGDSSDWQFGIMPVWLLGSAYERFLGFELDAKGHVQPKPDVRKAGGVYYTPEVVVQQIIDLTLGRLLQGKTPDQVLQLRIIDPSCGSGSFLIAAFNRMITHCIDWFSLNPTNVKKGQAFEYGGRWCLTTAFKRKLLQTCIYGIDIDPIAVQVACMSLYLKVLEDETQEALVKERVLFPMETFLPDLEENIVHANSLIPITAYPDHIDETYLANGNLIDWNQLLAKTPRKRGFDAVIGNPPWGADIESVSSGYLRLAHRDVVVRMPDTYIYFSDLSLAGLLRVGGLVGLVLPGTFLNQVDAKRLREKFLRSGIDAIADLGQGIFAGALNTTCIIVAGKGGTRPQHILTNDISQIDPELREASIAKWSAVERHRWESVVSSDPALTFFAGSLKQAGMLQEARGRMATLRDMVDDYGIQRGFTPDIIEAHLLSPDEAQKLGIESAALRRTLRGEDIKAFHPAVATMNVIYTSSSTNPDAIPKAIARLKSYRSENTCPEVRDGKHPWWRLHRPRKLEIFDRPKIIGLTTTRRIELVWDADEQLVVTDAMYVFAPAPNLTVS